MSLDPPTSRSGRKTGNRWRERIFRPPARAAGLPEDIRPRDLRSSFATLLIHEGRTIVEVAR